MVVNKIDRPAARIDEVIELTQDLFLDLATDAEQLEFPVLYAIAREGRAGYSRRTTLRGRSAAALRDDCAGRSRRRMSISTAPAQMLVASLDYDTHRGRIAIGRIHRGIDPHRRHARCTSTTDGDQTRQKVTSLATSMA